jgi:hypothetical protein
MNLLPTPTMRRLTIVKYLHTQALEQERKGGPLAGLALLPLHDAVELFLQVAAETQSLTMTSQQRTEFMAYWHAFSKTSLPLPYEPQMRLFNDARVAVKHKGLLPIQQQIEEFRFTVTAFLNDATPKVFQIEFDSISLSSLVQSDDVRSELQAAETAAHASQFKEALEHAAKAFHLSLQNHRWSETPRLFDPTDDARELRQRARYASLSQSGFSDSRSFEAVGKMGESLGEAITILAYHLDYVGYRRLRTYGPDIYSSERLAGMSMHWTQEPTADRSIVDQCVAFAVDAALRLERR